MISFIFLCLGIFIGYKLRKVIEPLIEKFIIWLGKDK